MSDEEERQKKLYSWRFSSRGRQCDCVLLVTVLADGIEEARRVVEEKIEKSGHYLFRISTWKEFLRGQDPMINDTVFMISEGNCVD